MPDQPLLIVKPNQRVIQIIPRGIPGASDAQVADLITQYLAANPTKQAFFVGPEPPDPARVTTAYAWLQTGLGPDGTDSTLWVEDGEVA